MVRSSRRARWSYKNAVPPVPVHDLRDGDSQGQVGPLPVQRPELRVVEPVPEGTQEPALLQ